MSESTEPAVEQALARAHQDEWARVVAGLARRFGDLDVAEEAAADAFVAALEHWPGDGIPPNPGAWLTLTATRRAIDRLRRESHRQAKQEAAHMLHDDSVPEPTGPVEDDRLRLIFTCCHPALAPEARVALTLRLLGGLTVPEIARAFLVQEGAMARRITRAKAKIKAAHIPFRLPTEADVRERLEGVLTVVFLIFNEGYLAGAGDDPVRVDLADEAIRLGRLLRGLLPDDGEVAGLLALMLLTDARRAARFSGDGDLVVLAEQDRGAWDRALLEEGHALVRERIAAVAAGGPPPGRYQLLAAINAVHTDAATAEATDWAQVVALYDALRMIDPSPVVLLNRAVAVAEVKGTGAEGAGAEGAGAEGAGAEGAGAEGAGAEVKGTEVKGTEVALAEVDELGEALGAYHPFHVTRAELLRRLGRDVEARAAYDRAIELTDNVAEQAHLERRRDELSAQ